MTRERGAARIRVLVVEDSPVLRELLLQVLGEDPQLQVVGTAENGEEAVRAVRNTHPDVVTMDYHMPKLNGMEATRRIMEEHPVPIVIVSGSSVPGEAIAAFRLLEAGAVAVVEKPPGPGHSRHDAAAAHLRQMVKLMSEVKVVRRWPVRKAQVAAAVPAPSQPPASPAGPRPRVRGIVIGASTGGPIVLKTILEGLPRTLAVPVLIVQHIAAGFTHGLADWLSQGTGFAVHIARDGERPLAGHVYLAPEGRQMKIAPDGSIRLDAGVPQNGHCPSVSCLFASAAEVWGAAAVGVLLTGMGRDGADELGKLREAGALTLAQDEESSVIHGMPGAAIALGAATHVLAPQQIAEVLAGVAA
jgi:two-component system chemotaxis response regulator CheB